MLDKPDLAYPKPFTERMQGLLAGEFASFKRALESPPSLAVRLNPAKPCSAFNAENSVPWCKHGKYLDIRPAFTFDPLFHAGTYYVQDASSMFLWWVLEQLQLPNAARIIDLCAAPGGKSTLLASFLNGRGTLVANETIRSRANILEENLTKWGATNCVITNNDSSAFVGLQFDCVVVDAPCSGEGLFRKTPEAITEWSEDNVALCSARQKRILHNAIQAVAPGGYLIYCTCTFETSENEDQVRWMLTQGFELAAISHQPEWGITDSGHGLRFYPHKVRGEGLFVAVLQNTGNTVAVNSKPRRKLERKNPNLPGVNLTNQQIFEHSGSLFAFPASEFDRAETWAGTLNIVRMGTRLGKLVKGELLPDHQLATSQLLLTAPRHELTLTQALAYLKKEDIPELKVRDGWQLVTYQNQSLGWIKGLGNRYNNYYPKTYRIRSKA